MAGSVNKVILIGNLGKDPDVRHFDNGGMVVNFPLATTETYRNKETGERITMPTDWHNISIRRPGLAKVAESYLKKGQLLYVEGKLRTRSYEKNGETRYITEVVVDDFTMLGSRNEVASPQQNTEENRESNTPVSSTQENPPLPNEREDDLPF